MTPHVKIYMDYFDYGMDDFVPCEVCNKKAVDVHHINGRGPGKDEINNLMGLCRKCHRRAHEGVIDKIVFQANHQMFLNNWRSTL